jgi:hypothetical protein
MDAHDDSASDLSDLDSLSGLDINDSDSLFGLDINDPDIDENTFMALSFRKWQKTAPVKHQRDGQLVDDHLPVDVLVAQFNKKLAMSSSAEPPSHHPSHGTLVVIVDPLPYTPCVRSMDSLDAIAIADMRLERHHRGKKTAVRVLTFGHRVNESAVEGIVEDENGTAITLQLHHQPEEDLVPAKEIMRPGDIFVVKEPCFEANTIGTYSLRVDHLGDLVRLDGEFENRIPSLWKRDPVTQTSTELRNEGNQAVKGERWAEAHRL